MAREAASEACDRAVQTHGGYGVAVEYDVERFWREARLTRIAPVSDEMVLNYIGEHVLGLPRSYWGTPWRAYGCSRSRAGPPGRSARGCWATSARTW
jgi:hypothetical protein